MIYLAGLSFAVIFLALTTGFTAPAAPVALMLGLLFGAIVEGVMELKGIREALEAKNRGEGRPTDEGAPTQPE